MEVEEILGLILFGTLRRLGAVLRRRLLTGLAEIDFFTGVFLIFWIGLALHPNAQTPAANSDAIDCV